MQTKTKLTIISICLLFSFGLTSRAFAVYPVAGRKKSRLLQLFFASFIFLTGLTFASPAFGATNVYYSVGQSTANLMTGTPTMTMTSGAAVFSVAQTGNIGVGDRVTYNTSSIAYIASKTDATGQDWQLVTALGATPPDVTTAVTVNSITHEYTSLEAAVTGASDVNHINNTNLTAANVILNIPCYYDSGPDTTPVTVTGYTTSATNYIKIYTPHITTTYPAEANYSQRAMGKWDGTKYSIYLANGIVLSNGVNYTVIDGLQFEGNGSDGYNDIGISTDMPYSSGNITVKNNILQGLQIGISTSRLTAGKLYYYNNVIYNCATGINASINQLGLYASFWVYNNTVVNCGVGFKQVAYATVYANNNLANRNTTDYSGTFDSSSSNNISKDGTSPNASFQNKTVQFADPANFDFHLSPSDTAAKGQGVNLYADASLPVTTDIDGQARPSSGNFDIGADQSATAIYYSVGQNTSDHSVGANGSACSSGGTSCTLGISGSTVTFATPQTATDMGVGDAITYTVSGTNYTCYITGKTSTSVWSCETATGGIPTAAPAGSSVVSITHAFSSLEGAVDANTSSGAFDANHLNTKDLYTNNYQLNIPCYYDSGPDTTAVNVQGWNTGVPNFIKIYTPNNTTTQVNQSQRAMGKWDNSKYSLVVNASSTLNLTVLDIKIDGLQVQNSLNDWNYAAIHLQPSNASSVWAVISNCVLISNNTMATEFDMYSPGSVYVFNNIMYSTTTLGNVGIQWYNHTSSLSPLLFAYNNTIYNFYYGLNIYPASEATLKNNIVQICTNKCYVAAAGSFNGNSADNISSDATSPNASYQNRTVAFQDAANNDFHLSPTDTAAKNAGVNLSSGDPNFNFTTDIDGQTRPATGAWDIGADQSATAIYYSVGQNTSNHMTGTPTVTIAGNAVTFSTGQTATDMGVGDVITYTVSGTNYACYITGKTSTDGTGWTCETATGGIPTAAPAGSSVVSITHAFSSLEGAVDANTLTGAFDANHLNTKDLYTNNYQLNIPCYYDSGPDTTAVNVQGWNTSDPNYIKIYTPNNTTTQVNQSQRAMGKWDTSKYQLTVGGTSLLYNDVNYTVILGLQFLLSGNTNNVNAVEVAMGTFSGNIVRNQSTGTGLNGIIVVGSGIANGSIVNVSNNIVYNFSTSGSSGFYSNWDLNNTYWYNNTVYNCAYGFYVGGSGDWRRGYLTNNIAANCETTCFYADANNNAGWYFNYNVSSDGSATAYGGTGNKINQSIYFVDVVNSDFHLLPTDTAAKNAGANLSADPNFAFTTDIDGQTRPATGAWDIGADQSANAVYYSVGQSTSNLMTGSPTLTMTGGAAVLSVAQTGNIGVGDRVTYNPFTISAFASGSDSNHTLVTTTATPTFQNGDYVAISGTTNYNGTFLVSSVSGSTFNIDTPYTSNNATGTVANIDYIAGKTDSTGQDWQLISPIGTAPNNVSTAETVVSITHEYTSLEAAVSGADDINHLGTSDLYDNNYQLYFPCYYDSGPDTTAVAVSGYTTAVPNYIKIYTPHNATTYPAEANYSQRAMGKWDGTKYNLTIGTVLGIGVSVSYIYIDGLQIYMNYPYNTGPVGISLGGASGQATISNSILKASIYNSLNGIGCAIAVGKSTTIYRIYNNIIYNFTAPSGNAYGIIYGASNPVAYIYNNTVVSCDKGLYNTYSNSGIYLKNNLVYNNTIDYFGQFNTSSTNNLSKDATAPGSNAKINQTVQFANPVNGDFHLAVTDTAARGAGANLSADPNFAFNTDQDGHPRTTANDPTWDIGAEQGATYIYYSVGQNTNDHSTDGSGKTCSAGGDCTLTIASGVATFNFPQTATDMGVGDAVTYNGSTVAYITRKIDTSHWGVETATGAVPPNVSSAVAVNSIAHAFSSLYAAINSGFYDSNHLNNISGGSLVNANYVLNIPCYYDTGPDTSATVYTPSYYPLTGPGNYIEIYTPNNTITEVNQTQRASGKWDSSKYSLVSSTLPIESYASYVRFDGLQIKVTSGVEAISVRPLSSHGSSDIYFWNNIFSGNPTANWGGIISDLGSSYPANLYIYNNIFYNYNTSTAAIDLNDYGGTALHAYIYNNTIYGPGISIPSDIAPPVIKNNILQNGGNYYNPSLYDPSSTNNITGYSAKDGAFGVQADSGTTNSSGVASNQIIQTGKNFTQTVHVNEIVQIGSSYSYVTAINSATQLTLNDAISGTSKAYTIYTNRYGTVQFANAAQNDFHLSPNDTLALGQGANLSDDPYLSFSTDITGATRGNWSIGAFDYTAIKAETKGTVQVRGAVKFK